MFDCPALTARGVTLRAVCVEDEPFQRALFETARPDAAFLVSVMPEPTRKLFLDQQFQFQNAYYARAYPGADWLLIVAGGAPVGRLIVERVPAGWCVVDIALLPAWRGQGIGALLLKRVQAAAVSAGAPCVVLSVDTSNPARRLYGRLGFVVEEEAVPKVAMAWRPSLSASRSR